MSMPPPSSRGPEFSDSNDDYRPTEDLPTLVRYRVVLHRVADQGLLMVAAVWPVVELAVGLQRGPSQDDADYAAAALLLPP